MNSPYYGAKVITDLNDIGLPPTISKSSGLRRPQHHYAKPPPTPLPLGHGKPAIVAKRFNHGKSPSSPGGRNLEHSSSKDDKQLAHDGVPMQRSNVTILCTDRLRVCSFDVVR